MEMVRGTIKSFKLGKPFGSVRSDGEEKDIYLHLRYFRFLAKGDGQPRFMEKNPRPLNFFPAIGERVVMLVEQNNQRLYAKAWAFEAEWNSVQREMDERQRQIDTAELRVTRIFWLRNRRLRAISKDELYLGTYSGLPQEVEKELVSYCGQASAIQITIEYKREGKWEVVLDTFKGAGARVRKFSERQVCVPAPATAA